MKIDSKNELIYKVQSKDLAKELSIEPQDDFPEVFATSRMIGLMELAAARLMQPILTKTELSVGVNVNVTHFAATPDNEKVIVIATYKGKEGKLFKFEVELQDKGGKAAGNSYACNR